MQPNENPAGDQPAVTNDDSAEWDEAGLDFLSDKGVDDPGDSKEQETIDEQENNDGNKPDDANATKTPEGADATKKPGENNPPVNAEGDGEKREKPVQPTGEENPEGKKPDSTPQPTPEQQEAARRSTQLSLEADRKELAKDIRTKMFSEVPTRLEDADGDPIETIQDVMQLRNPNTGQRFNAEEAAQYLLQAQRHFDKTAETTRSQIDEVVEANLNIKEEADAVMGEYGEILKHMPKLRTRLWNQFKATLGTDESGEVFTKMPLSMKEFYDTAMAPYIKQVEDMESQAQTEADKTAQEAADKKKKEAANSKRRSQSDREDVFSTRTKIEEGMDSDEKQWAEVAKEHYEQ